jgi:hypothetical protein
MRSYDVAITALAIGAPTKWVDNLLSQHVVPDVVQLARGIPRKLPHAALIRIALVRELHVQLGMGVREALALATQLLEPGSGPVHSRGHVRVTLDRAALERQVGERLRESLESAPAPARRRAARRDA